MPLSVETFNPGGLIHSIAEPDHQQQGGVRAAAANGETLDTMFCSVLPLKTVKFCKFVALSFYECIGVFLD